MSKEYTWSVPLSEPGTTVVISTSNHQGEPHSSIVDLIELDASGYLIYSEYFESSQTNKNLTRALWYDKQVTFLIIAGDGQHYQVKGIPIRAVVSGKEFESRYARAKKLHADSDLSTVWTIQVNSVSDESWETRQRVQNEQHFIVSHLDSLSTEEPSYEYFI